MAMSEIIMKLDAKELIKDLREELRLVFNHGHEAGIKSAEKEGFAGMSFVMEADLQDKAWAEFEAEAFPNG